MKVELLESSFSRKPIHKAWFGLYERLGSKSDAPYFCELCECTGASFTIPIFKYDEVLMGTLVSVCSMHLQEIQLHWSEDDILYLFEKMEKKYA